MPYFAPQPIPVKCPSCGAEFTVPAYMIIDAQDMADAVQALIMGALNVFQCPRCGTQGMLSVPLLYHHAEKKLAYLFVPPQMGMPQPERQRMIGELTRAVMNHLPNDHPKGYLLQPREFLTLPSMIDAIMEAEGIDKALLEERRKKGELIDKLLAVVDDNVAFAAVVGQHRDKLDAEFYELLRYARDTAAAIGHREEAQKLERLRQRLLPLTEWGRKERAYDRAIDFLRSRPDRKAFLNRLLEAEDDVEVEALVKVARPLADYVFFKMLSDRIREAEKAGDQDEAQRLTQLRDRVLQIAEEVDKETAKAVEEATTLLRTLLQAPDLDKAVEENLEKIDDTFLFVLSSHIEEAERKQLREMAANLQRVWEAIRRHFQPHVPPEIMLIEDLMSLQYPDETRAYLEQKKGELSPEVLTLMDAIAKDMEQQGLHEEAKRLRAIRAQALALVPASTA